MAQQPRPPKPHLLILEDDDNGNDNDNGNHAIEEEAFVDLLPLSAASTTSPHGQDIAMVMAQFKSCFNGCEPHCVARAPGRVNIIGEHIDYNGFGVLPMALEQSVFVAAASVPMKNSNNDSNQDSICLDIQSTSPNAKPRQYMYPIDKLLAVKSNNDGATDSAPFDASGNKDWSHYFLCAFFGALEELSTKFEFTKEVLRKKRFLFLIHGTVPQGAGVSSSSALVVSSALAVLTLLQSVQQQQQPQTPKQQLDSSKSKARLSLTRPQIAHLCARCERWVGTEGGGMDQAISLFAQAGSGRYIQFQPTFRHKAVILPSNGSWVVCHSLEESHKRLEAATLFNKRVVECKIGCRLLADALQWKLQHHSGYPSSLWELVSKSGMSLVELEKLAQECIVETCTKSELMSLILPAATKAVDTTATALQLADALGITRKAGIEVLELADAFVVRDRLLHVLTETRRVQEFVAHSCEELSTGAGEGNNTTSVLQTMGILMAHSHRSCSKLYDCSSVQVDRLQEACMGAPGAVGSRMTGAGWGGCVISLVETKEVPDFCNHVRKHYYATLPEESLKNTNAESDYLFVTKPSQGSQVCIGGELAI